MSTAFRLSLLVALTFSLLACAQEETYETHQTRVSTLPTSKRVLVKDGVKLYEYQGVFYRERVDGNGWVVVSPEELQVITQTTVTTSSDGKTIRR